MDFKIYAIFFYFVRQKFDACMYACIAKGLNDNVKNQKTKICFSRASMCNSVHHCKVKN